MLYGASTGRKRLSQKEHKNESNDSLDLKCTAEYYSGDGSPYDLENDISATPNVQVSRDIITPNGCHLTLVFPKEGRKGVREEIAEILRRGVKTPWVYPLVSGIPV